MYQGAVTVLNVAPTVVIDAVNEPTNSRSRTVQFHFTDPNPGDGLPAQGNRWTVRVEFGDGLTTIGSYPQGASITQTRTYSAAGSYTILITVTDKDNGSGTATVKTKVK
jgi:PKD repeat protein